MEEYVTNVFSGLQYRTASGGNRIKHSTKVNRNESEECRIRSARGSVLSNGEAELTAPERGDAARDSDTEIST